MVVKAFNKFAVKASDLLGSPQGFVIGLLFIVFWTATHTVNTGATVATYLMVFVVQSTQNRDKRVNQLKLDAILEAIETARNKAIGLEHKGDELIQEIQEEIEDNISESK